MDLRSETQVLVAEMLYDSDTVVVVGEQASVIPVDGFPLIGLDHFYGTNLIAGLEQCEAMLGDTPGDVLIVLNNEPSAYTPDDGSGAMFAYPPMEEAVVRTNEAFQRLASKTSISILGVVPDSGREDLERAVGRMTLGTNAHVDYMSSATGFEAALERAVGPKPLS